MKNKGNNGLYVENPTVEYQELQKTCMNYIINSYADLWYFKVDRTF